MRHVLIHIHLRWCCLLSSCEFQPSRPDVGSDTLGIISQKNSILRSLCRLSEFTLSWSVSWRVSCTGPPCARAVRGAVGPFLSGSSAFVACTISYNRLGFSRKPYRALAPNLSVLSGYPTRDSVKIPNMRKILGKNSN